MITREMVAEMLRHLERVGALERVGSDPTSGEPVYQVRDQAKLDEEVARAHGPLH